MNPLRRRFAVHLRNHRKLVLVDGEVGFTGGMNVGDEYYRRRVLRRIKGPRPFRDNHLRIRGPAVHALALTFAADWQFAAAETLELPPAPPHPQGQAGGGPPGSHVAPYATGSIVAIVPSGPDQEFNANALTHFSAVSSARRRVYVTSPYFIPDESALSAMVSAALRRVDVRVMVPRHSDVKIAQFAGRWYYGKLLRGGVRVFEYEPAMLHAKTLVVDGNVAIVGSANADIRSWRLNFELGAMVADPAFARTLEERFVRDLAHSHEVTLEEIERRSTRAKIVHGLARLLSPFL
jgi:cardiolipin synthase